MVQPSAEELYGKSLATAKVAVPYRSPHHRKRRIAKKWAKRYADEHPRAVALVAAAMVPAVRGPLGSWRCPKCARTMGGYQAVARAMFPIQELPPGALPFYDSHPVEARPEPRPMTDEEKRLLIERTVATLKK